MRQVEILKALGSLPLESLEVFQLLINDKIASLKEESVKEEETKAETGKVVDIFAEEFPELAQVVKHGRKQNPNTKSGKMRQALTNLLEKHPEGVVISGHWDFLSNETGLSVADCKATAQDISKRMDIIKDYGYWRMRKAA
jgi:hypothetical protein